MKQNIIFNINYLIKCNADSLSKNKANTTYNIN